MSEIIKSAAAAELLGISVSYFSNRLCIQPGFPSPIRYTPRGHKHWRRDDILHWREKMQQRNAA